ncbi:MAG: DUF4199 domain-containing protein [Chitinophagales bacterium]
MMSRELRYGLIGGFITLIWMGIGDWQGWDQISMGTYAPYLSLLILAVAIYVSILFKRDKDLEGAITFGNAFITGISVSFMIGLMVGAYLLVYTQYINPDVVNQAVKEAQDFYKTQKGVTKEEIDNAANSAKAFYSPFGQFTYGIGTTMLTGGLIALVCAMIMRREKKPI